MKLYKDLTEKHLLLILQFILPSLKNKIKPVKMCMSKSRWGEKYTFECNDKNKSLFIRRHVTRGIGKLSGQPLGNYDELIPEAIRIESNWDISVRTSVYKGESRSSVYYANEWAAPVNILKIYKYIKSLGYIVDIEE